MMNKIFCFLIFFVFGALTVSDVYSFGGIPPSYLNQSGNGVSQCVVVKVGDPKEEPDTSACKTSGAGNTGGAPSETIAKVIELARTQLGKTYVLGACHGGSITKYPPIGGCSSYDCSSFVQWAYYWGTDKKFLMKGQTCMDFGDCYAYYAGMQYFRFDSSLYTKFLGSQKNQMVPGDLVYFGRTEGNKTVVSHVALYAGDGKCGGNDCIIHARGKKYGVVETSLSARKDIVGFLRPIIK